MRSRIYSVSLCSILCALLLTACGGGGGGGNSSGSNLVTVTGSVQKGPFVDLQVVANALGGDGEIIDTYDVQISQQSNYSFRAPPQQIVSVQAYGQYRDETSGELREVSADNPIESIFSAADAVQNVNVLTDLAASHFRGQIETGEVNEEQVLSSNEFVATRLGFEADQLLGALDLNKVVDENDPNFLLLVLSAGLISDLPETQGTPDLLTGIEQVLEQGVEDVALTPLFNGIDVGALIQEIEDAGIIPLPTLEVEVTETLLCEPVCQIIPGLESKVSVSGTTVYEAQGKALVSLYRTGLDLSQINLTYVMTSPSQDGATPGVDYLDRSGSVNFASGEREATLWVDLLVDNVAETVESVDVEFALESGSPFSLSQSVAKVSILDTVPSTIMAPESLSLVASACVIEAGGIALISDPTEVAKVCDSQLVETRFLDGDTPTGALVHLDFEADCSGTADCATSSFWPVIAELVSLDDESTVQSAIDLADLLLAREDYEIGLYESKWYVSLEGDSVRDFLAQSLAAGEQLQIRIKGQEGSDNSLVSVATNVSVITPSPDNVFFGDTPLSLASVDGLSGPASCSSSPGVQYTLEGSYGYDVSLNGETATQEISGPICVSFTANEQEGFFASVNDANINLGGVSLGLPDNHYVYAMSTPAGLAPQRISAGFPLLPIPESGGSTDSPFSLQLFISALGLPFGLEVSGASLTQQGIVLSYDGIDFEQSSLLAVDDPRSAGVASNQNFYQSVQAGTLLLQPDGISAALNFGAGSGDTAWPAGSVSWGGFTVTIEGGQLANHSLPGTQFSMEQRQSCDDIACAQGVSENHAVTVDLDSDAGGSALGYGSFSAASELAWGGAQLAERAWRLEAGVAVGDTAALNLPGFVHPSDSPVTDSLAASGFPASNGFDRFLPGSDEFMNGNGLYPGITIGPDTYVDAQGDPVAGLGLDFDGRQFEMTPLTSVSQSFEMNSAAKFVVTNAGVTGVVNAEPAALPQAVNIANYDMLFSRFALRTRDNRNDDFNWVDGAISLPGDAGLDIEFKNLVLGCDGSPGKARLAKEPCDGLCDLDSWRTEIELYSLAFGDITGNPLPACSGFAPSLVLGHETDFKALNAPLSMVSSWDFEGSLQSSRLQAQEQYRLDSRDDQEGYPFLVDAAALNPAIQLTQPENLKYGTLTLEGQLGLPFWLPLDVSARLGNTTDSGAYVQEATVVVSREDAKTTAFTNQSDQLNVSLQQALIDDSNFDLMAKYQWGNTGFSFELPVYYDVALNGDDVSFLGRRVEKDLFVLEAGAGVDFIEPARTKLSFGASADFVKLKETRFQVDITDPDGLGKVDELLVQTGLVPGPVISPVLGEISEAMSVAKQFAGRGLDDLIEELLTQSIESAGNAVAPILPDQKDPFDLVSEGMAIVRNFPNQLIKNVDEYVFVPANSVLDEQEQYLRGELLALVTQVEQKDPGAELSAELKGQLRVVKSQLNRASQLIDQTFEPVDNALDQILSQITQIQTTSSEVESARQEIESIVGEVTSVVADQCEIEGSVLGSESSGYLEGAFKQLGDVRGLVQLLASNDLLVSLAELLIDDPKVKTAINDTQNTLKEEAEQLLVKVAEAETSLRESLCQSDVSTLLDQTTALLNQIQTHMNQMNTFVATAQQQVSNLQIQVRGVKATVSEPLAVLSAAVNELQSETHSLLKDFNGTELVNRLDEAIAEATQRQITTLVARAEGETDIFSVAFSSVRDTLNQGIRGPFIETVRDQTKDLLPFGHFTADQLRRRLAQSVLQSEPVRQIREQFNEDLVEVVRQSDNQIMVMTDQANQLVADALSEAQTAVNDVLDEANSAVRDIPLDAAKVDGFGVIAGQELERAHLYAEWTMGAGEESESPSTYNAALDAIRWSANGKSAGCAAPGAESNLDVTISTTGIPATINENEILIKKLSLGFTLGDGGTGFAYAPLGVNGGLSTSGEIKFEEFQIYDPAFAAGIGVQEVYLGAAAGAVFSDVQAEVAFLLGRTCNQDVLQGLDPKVADFIPIPDSGFAGVYARGAASIPVFTNGCPLTIGAAAEFGTWVLAGPPLQLGGIVGGGAYGKVGCVGALRGQIRALGQVDTAGNFSFLGEGFGVAGLGLCEPATWTTIERSREDGFCGTVDAMFTAGFKNGWSISNLSAGGVY